LRSAAVRRAARRCRIVDSLRRHIGDDTPIDTIELITTYVRRIEVRRSEIAISLLSKENASVDEGGTPLILTVPWSKTSHRRHRDVIAPEGPSRTQVLPIRSDTRTKLVTAIALGRQWLSEIEIGAVTVDGIAARDACSKRHVNMTISLAFLAPSLVKAAVEGRLPHGIGVARLFDAQVCSATIRGAACATIKWPSRKWPIKSKLHRTSNCLAQRCARKAWPFRPPPPAAWA
jgi:hypothetical protein